MININLIAERRARQIREALFLRFAALGVVALFVVMVVLNATAAMERNDLQRQIRQVNAELRELEIAQAKLNEIIEEINQYKPLVTLLEHVRVSEGVWMTIFADVSKILPDDVVLSTIGASPNKDGVALRLAGAAKDQDTVGKFMVALVEETKWAQKPTTGPLTLEDKDGITRVRFDLHVPVRDLLGGEL